MPDLNFRIDTLDYLAVVSPPKPLNIPRVPHSKARTPPPGFLLWHIGGIVITNGPVGPMGKATIRAGPPWLNPGASTMSRTAAAWQWGRAVAQMRNFWRKSELQAVRAGLIPAGTAGMAIPGRLEHIWIKSAPYRGGFDAMTSHFLKIRVTIMKILLFLAAVVIAAAGALWSGLYNISAIEPHWDITHKIIAIARDRSITVHSANVKVPPLDDPTLMAKGASHYAEMCRICHGAPGVPADVISQGLYPAPANLLSGHVQKEWERQSVVLDSGKTA